MPSYLCSLKVHDIMFLTIFVDFLEFERGRNDVVLNGLSLDGRKTEA